MSFPHFTVFNSSASVRNNSLNAALEKDTEKIIFLQLGLNGLFLFKKN